MKLLAAVALLAAPAVAQDHAYEPDAAWLAHATEKWLVWLPDDKGASLDPPAEEAADETDINGLKLPKKFLGLASKTVYVLQSAADPKQLRKVVVEWKDPKEEPRGLRPVAVRDDGTLVLAGMDGDEIVLCWPDGRTSPASRFARDKPAVLVAAYPDGVVLQTPPPDELKPRGPARGLKEAALYWVAWGEFGLESEKAQRMSFHEGVVTASEVHVARFGDDVAMPVGIYSPRRKRRQRFCSESAQSIYAFDGRVALGSAFSYSVPLEDPGLPPAGNAGRCSRSARCTTEATTSRRPAKSRAPRSLPGIRPPRRGSRSTGARTACVGPATAVGSRRRGFRRPTSSSTPGPRGPPTGKAPVRLPYRHGRDRARA